MLGCVKDFFAGYGWLCHHLIQRHCGINSVHVECAHQVAPTLDGHLGSSRFPSQAKRSARPTGSTWLSDILRYTRGVIPAGMWSITAIWMTCHRSKFDVKSYGDMFLSGPFQRTIHPSVTLKTPGSIIPTSEGDADSVW